MVYYILESEYFGKKQVQNLGIWLKIIHSKKRYDWHKNQ
jgi:hypothetical protein